MLQIKIDSDSKVIAIYYLDDEKEGWIQIDSIPEPEQIEGRLPVMYYRNGAIEYEYEDVPPTPEPEPIPEPEPTPEPIPDTMIRQVAMFATMAVNTMSLSDEQSLQIKDLYPEWASFVGKSLAAGFKVLYEGRLYKVRQPIATVLDNQVPSELTAALYEEINEAAAGTLDDPIPYNGNMELFEGKYYSQNGVTYKCTRSTGQAVYHDLSALVGIYVEKA